MVYLQTTTLRLVEDMEDGKPRGAYKLHNAHSHYISHLFIQLHYKHMMTR